MDYQTCLELAQKLDAIQKNDLQDSPIVKQIAMLIQKDNVRDLATLNEIVETMYTSQGSDDLSEIVLTPSVVVNNEFLAYLISDWVKEIRRAVFRSEQPPFKSYDEAAEWMQTQNAVPREWVLGESPDKLPPNESKRHKFRVNVGFYNREGHYDIICARINSKLEKVIRQAKRVRDYTHLEHSSIVMHILAGTRPFLPPYEVGFPTEALTFHTDQGEVEYLGRQVLVTFNVEPNFDVLMSLYRYLREHLGIERTKSLRGKHMELYRLVAGRTGPRQGKGAVEFWRSVQEDWNKSHPDDVYVTWKGVKIAYERLVKTLNRQVRRPEDKVRWILGSSSPLSRKRRAQPKGAPKRKKGEGNG